MIHPVPIALFVYNRPNHTLRTLESLAACYRLEECQVYIFSDGPFIADQEPAVREVRSLIQKWGVRHRAQIVEQNHNLGLAHSIVSGVTRLCNEYERVIVVEDDLNLHPAFIHYMLSALERYQNDERVGQISGYMFPVEHPSPHDCFFLPLTTTWGWATWERSWSLFDWDVPRALQFLTNPTVRSRFNLNDAYPYANMLVDRLKGKNQSWGILFYWACFSTGKLVLHPAQSLVRNIGFDGSGTHGSQPSMASPDSQFADRNNVFDPIFPAKVEIDQEAFGRICGYLHQTVQTSMLDWMIRKISHVSQQTFAR